MPKTLIISLHDFHPGSRVAIEEQIQFCANLGATEFSILTVPQFHHGSKINDDTLSLDFLKKRQALGDDIVLHGYYHDRADRNGGSVFFTKLYTANESEFLDLPDDEFVQRLAAGQKLWSDQGWRCDGFIAPAWLMPREQDSVLKKMGFTYTTRLGGIYLLKKGVFVPTQSLCYSTRSSWRRICSLAWNAYLFQRLLGKDVIRLSLHPHDLEFVSIRKQIASIIERALAEGYQPLSYYHYATL